MLRPGLYRHYKGSYYKVIDVARHSENEEQLVIYQALYADKGLWARPLSMFIESIEYEGSTVARFEYCLEQSIVQELAVLEVKPEQGQAFETAFQKAEPILTGREGYISHSLKQSVHNSNRYLLLVEWQAIGDHTSGFRESPEYQEWAKLLHGFYNPMPTVEYYR